MKCPRCGNEWDIGKHLCPQCGLSESRIASLGTASPALQKQHSFGSDSVAPLPPDTMASSPPPVASPFASGAVTPLPITIPVRPQAPSTPPSIDQTFPAAPHLPPSLRARKLFTAPLSQGDIHVPDTPGVRGRMPGIAETRMAQWSSTEALRPLPAGLLLHGGRYRLRALQSRQEWAAGAYEAVWAAQDAQRSGSLVMINELALPGQNSRLVQALLRASTIALTSIGRHTIIPTLWDIFGEHGRHFLVFKPVGGESLLMYMRRIGRALPEQDVIACCLQAIGVLELLSQQTPPMVHGLIRPEHVVISRDGASYRLTNFSVVLAGGGTRFVAGIEHACLSPYTAPELARGVVDVRSDLYSLLATAYHAITGSRPNVLNGSIPQALRLNPLVTPQFDAILAKGLRTSIGQRFQRPSELRQALLALRASMDASSHVPGEQSTPHFSNVNSQALSHMPAPGNASDDRGTRLSLPPTPSPAEARNDMRLILFWIICIALCLIAAMLLIRAFW